MKLAAIALHRNSGGQHYKIAVASCHNPHGFSNTHVNVDLHTLAMNTHIHVYTRTN